MAQLTKINHTGPVRVRELGAGGAGLDWTVSPENFASVVEMVNKFGGPSRWEITAL